MTGVAGAFGFPFRPGWAASWLRGLACLVLLPVAFPLLFGYAVQVVREAHADPAAGPPPWRLGGRLLSDGLWSFLQLSLLTLPFAVAAWLLASLLLRFWTPTGEPFFDRAYALLPAGFVAGLAWGLAALVLIPPTLARFAQSGRPRDLADVAAGIRTVRRRFAEWNVVGAVVVTAWVLAVASAGLLCGVVAGVYYAILVSAHACSALTPGPPARG